MVQRHPHYYSLVVGLAAFLFWAHPLSKPSAPALAEDLAELSLSLFDAPQHFHQEQAMAPHSLFLHPEFDLVPHLSMRAWAPTTVEKEPAKTDASTQRTLAPSLSWKNHDQAGESLLINIQPHFTRDPVETARSPFDRGESYHKSPLNSNDPIYGLGVATDYELVPWLHFNSAFRFNLHNGKSNPGSSAASPGDSTSHSLFFGVTVPLSSPSDE